MRGVAMWTVAREAERPHQLLWLRADLVEAVVRPLAFAEADLELLRRQHRLLVLQDVLDGDPRTRRVDPRVRAIALEQIRREEAHEEQARVHPVLLCQCLER